MLLKHERFLIDCHYVLSACNILFRHILSVSLFANMETTCYQIKYIAKHVFGTVLICIHRLSK